MINDEALQRIEKLHQMKQDGIITEAEFEEGKQRLLLGSPTHSRPNAMSTESQSLLTTDDLFVWIKRPLQHYADFNGRSRRKEYWLFQLVPASIAILFILLAGLGLFDLAMLVLVVAVLGLFIPQLALQVRRFHDQDKSGWFALFNLIPYIGPVIAMIFMFFEGTRGDNQYGPDPKATD